MLFRSSLPNDKRYFPMLLTETEGEQAALSLINIWNQYKTLPQEIRNILVSDEISEKLKDLQKKFDIDIDTLGKISLLVRQLFFGEFKLPELESRLGNILVSNGKDQTKAREIAEFIQEKILTIKPKPQEEEAPQEEKRAPVVKVRMPLLQALSKYESLGNQLISQERIRIKSQSEPVRPSLLYWVKYYRDELGIGHHDSVQRGNFLFRSENGKRLSAEERERVNLVLKSIEENFPLEIDTERQEILFPVFVSAPAPRAPLPVSRPVPPMDDRETRESAAEKFQPRANPAFSFGQGGMIAGATPRPLVPETSGGELTFSSKHVFPAEKSSETVEATLTPIVPQAPAPQANPFRIRPVSLGEER